MIGIVVVSHSPALAQAAVDLALEMVAGEKPAIAIAAGAGDGVIGTDAVAVAAAIDEVASAEGVLVIMDLGSAVMSAEMALDFVTTDATVRLSSAPFVEGLLAAIVTASGGVSLDAVDREARSALRPKLGMLGEPDPESPGRCETPVAVQPDLHSPVGGDTAGEVSVEVTVLNPDGLHARPAATLVSAVSGFDAKLTFANRRTPARPVSANSLIGLLSLGARSGDVLVIGATGPQAAEAVAAVVTLFADGFGELPA